MDEDKTNDVIMRKKKNPAMDGIGDTSTVFALIFKILKFDIPEWGKCANWSMSECRKPAYVYSTPSLRLLWKRFSKRKEFPATPWEFSDCTRWQTELRRTGSNIAWDIGEWVKHCHTIIMLRWPMELLRRAIRFNASTHIKLPHMNILKISH